MSSKKVDTYGVFPEVQDDDLDGDYIYEAPITDLSSSNNTFDLPMHETLTDTRTGGTRSHFHGNQQRQVVYQNNFSGCNISINRLVWIDGWYGAHNSPIAGDTHDSPSPNDAMTLIVLKLVINPVERDSRITFISLRLMLKSSEPDGPDPVLMSWGPFRRPEMWNVTEAHKRTAVTTSLKASGGFAGQELATGAKSVKEKSWNEDFSTYGRSVPLIMDRKTNIKDPRLALTCVDSEPNAVMWQVVGNKATKSSIGHEIRVAALFKRPGPPSSPESVPEQYLASIKVEAQTNSLKDAALRTFHLDPRSDTINWRVDARPGDVRRCYAEGNDILKYVNPKALGSVTSKSDDSDLDTEWLNKWDRGEPIVISSPHPKTASRDPTARRSRGQRLSATSTSLRKVPSDKSTSLHVEDADITQDTHIEIDSVRVEDEDGAWNVEVGLGAGSDEGPVDKASGDESMGGNDESETDGEAGEIPDTPEESCNRGPGLRHEKKSTQSHQSRQRRGKYNSHWRLVELEQRAARAEARIAQQDQRISELQQLLARVSLALISPVTLAPSPSSQH